MPQITDVFASPDERLVAVLGNNALQSFLSSGTIGNAFILLSDKRIYFRGRCLRRVGRHFSSIREDRTVDVADVTGTGFVHFNHIWMKVLAIIATAWAAWGLLFMVINALTSTLEEFNPIDLLVFAMPIVPVFFFILYKMTRRSVFEIAFAGGGIGLDVRSLNAAEADYFQKCIKLVGDDVKRKEQMYGHGTSAAAELSQLAALVEKGLLTQQEFDEQKARLLHHV